MKCIGIKELMLCSFDLKLNLNNKATGNRGFCFFEITMG